MQDKRFYVVDETDPDSPHLADGQPEEGFEHVSDGHRWFSQNASAYGPGQRERTFSVTQYSDFFAKLARQQGVLAGAQAVAGASTDNEADRAPREDEPWPRGEIAALGVFDEWSFDARVLALAGISIERVTPPEGYEGDYARLTLRFPTGDGLVISPRPDGTLVMAWNYPDGPREDVTRFGGDWTPERVMGMPMYEHQRGVGPVLAYVVQAVGREGEVNARLRLTDAGRAGRREE